MREALLMVGCVLAVGCGSGRDRVGADAGPGDSGIVLLDTGPPIVPHPCERSGSCLDWIATTGTTDPQASLRGALAVDDGVVIVGGVQPLTSNLAGAPVGGTTVGTVSAHSKPAYFAHLDTTGAVIGGAEYDPSSNQDELEAVARLSSGDFVCVGYSNVSESVVSDHQIFAVRVAPNGTQRWSSTYGAHTMSTGINFPTELAHAVAVSDTDEIFVAGKVDSPYPGATGAPGGAILLEVDPSTGAAVWARTYGAGTLTQVVVSGDTVFVALDASSGTVDLGAAGMFPVPSTGLTLVAALSRVDGTPIAVHTFAGAPSASVTSLVLDGDGLLVAVEDYAYSPTAGTSYSGGHVDHLDVALTTPTELAYTVDSPYSAVRDSGGEVLVSGAQDSRYVFFGLYDASGRRRFSRKATAAIGYQGMRATASTTDERVYLFGYYTQAFSFESLSASSPAGLSYGWNGYVIQTTIPP